jgi:hypothetical protein
VFIDPDWDNCDVRARHFILFKSPFENECAKRGCFHSDSFSTQPFYIRNEWSGYNCVCSLGNVMNQYDGKWNATFAHHQSLIQGQGSALESAALEGAQHFRSRRIFDQANVSWFPSLPVPRQKERSVSWPNICSDPQGLIRLAVEQEQQGTDRGGAPEHKDSLFFPWETTSTF